MRMQSPLNLIDFYKSGHIYQYPDHAELVYANLSPRHKKLANVELDFMVFFGLQYFIKDYLQSMFSDGFFNLKKEVAVAAYKRRMDTSLGPNAIKIDHIEALHDLGYLPLEIRALPEGTKVPMNVPCLTIHNTVPEFYWLVNYIETILSAYLWKPSTSATTAHWYKKVLSEAAIKTVGDDSFTGFQGHDFSFRGMSGWQDAAASGAGHLLSFVGTDTVPAIDFLEDFYGANAEKELIGCSVPATEHSVMCMGICDVEAEIAKGYHAEIVKALGKGFGTDPKLIAEYLTDRRLITETYPNGIVSIVSDSFDFWRVLTEILPALKQ